MSVSKRGNSQNFYVQFRLAGRTIIRSAKTTSRRVAEQFEARLRAEIHAQVFLGEKPRIRLSEAFVHFARSKEGTPNHINILGHVRTIKAAIPDCEYLDQLSLDHVERYLEIRRGEGVAAQTLKHGLAAISGTIQLAKQRRFRLPDLQLPAIKVANGRLRYLSTEEERSLLKALDPMREGPGIHRSPNREPELRQQLQDLYDLVVLLLDTGARCSEIRRLKWQHVDLDAGTIHLWRPKVSNESVLFITRRCHTILQRRKLTATSEYVFTNKLGGMRNHPHASWRKAFNRAGLRPGVIGGYMTQYFFRYRPIDAVLDGFHELENQEIYFSTTDELNDPMEGFKDLFWSGDEIVWRNLLKHYILCLLQTASIALIAGKEFDTDVVKSVVFWVPAELPDAPIREIYARIASEFLAEPAAAKFIQVMAERKKPVRRSELTSYLRSLHGFGLKFILQEYVERGLFALAEGKSSAPDGENLRKHAIALMEAAAKIEASEQASHAPSEAAFAAMEGTIEQVMLISEYNLKDRDLKFGLAFLSNRFPAAYVAALDGLVHRDWYVACFAKTPENHSMWSTYAGGHRGVCLMFKTQQNPGGNPSLVVERVVGMGGSNNSPTAYSKNSVLHELGEVQYTGKYPAIDFFRSLGTISEMHLNNFWYRGEDGRFSVCRDAIYTDHKSWQADYWHTFSESALRKTPEWAHEEEYRIVAHSGIDMRAKEKRKLKYRFDDLAGVVFGARTDIEDKLKIMRIIDTKCLATRRTDFKFYEIRYLYIESRFQLFPLDLLKCSDGDSAN